MSAHTHIYSHTYQREHGSLVTELSSFLLYPGKVAPNSNAYLTFSNDCPLPDCLWGVARAAGEWGISSTVTSVIVLLSVLSCSQRILKLLKPGSGVRLILVFPRWLLLLLLLSRFSPRWLKPINSKRKLTLNIHWKD